MAGEGLNPTLLAERFRIQTPFGRTPAWACVLDNQDCCPSELGYGLGWTVFTDPDRTFIQHGGNDLGEHAMVVAEPDGGNAVIILINGGNGWRLSPTILDLIEPRHPVAAHFQALIARHL